MGDGKIHHFGINQPGQEPCVLVVKCDKITNLGTAEEWSHSYLKFAYLIIMFQYFYKMIAKYGYILFV